MRSRAISNKNIVQLTFTIKNQTNDVIEKYHCMIVETDELPFSVTKTQTYIER
jgi:hypothetical protein